MTTNNPCKQCCLLRLCWIMLHIITNILECPFQQRYDKVSFNLGHDLDGLCPPRWHPSAGCCLHLPEEHQNWGSRIRHIWGQTQGQARGHVGFLHGAPCPSVLGIGPEGGRQKSMVCQKKKSILRLGFCCIMMSVNSEKNEGWILNYIPSSDPILSCSNIARVPWPWIFHPLLMTAYYFGDWVI